MNSEQELFLESTRAQSVVIVDDTPDNLRLLVGIIKERGYKVRPAPSGALNVAEKIRIFVATATHKCSTGDVTVTITLGVSV